MAEIPNNFYPIPAGGVEQKQPQTQEQLGKRPQQSQQLNNKFQRSSAKAPLNVLPSDEALNRLITRAQDAQNQGKTLERGSILNLIV